MVLVDRTQSDARAIVEPQAAPLGLFGWYFQPLTPPDALHPLEAHMPALLFQQPVDAPVAIATILACQCDNRCCQGILIGTALRKLALC